MSDGPILRLTYLGKGGSDVGECPTLYASDHGTYVIIGWRTARPGTVEIPHLLLGFAEPDTFIGTPLTDTGRGTFTLTGRPITEAETLAQMSIEPHETAIEVPKTERAFYGAPAA
ncbi:Uncharacterised protein [Nocardia otitidiscaviarum]|uniref:Uncharacterized protein n=1 Tax=Nocardia otitidiscaviarum TaxID=1823 RepID=A0A378YDA9_9NOCA|nr:hypothetical protein [Nocardia otitidiscaviarum]SUA75176.1 Uncharacterised protein [Nocardia otitidiscaviarum]